ncbi:MAG: hemerythrin domain-containing protein [Ilumatobacteraceae bacterium]
MTLDIVPCRSVTDGFVLVHRTLVDTGQRIAAALRRAGDGRDLRGLAEAWQLYRAGLAEHHEGETDVVFPLVSQRDPTFAELESSMAHEHAVIDDLLRAADRAVDAAVSDRTAAACRSATAAVEALIGTLDEHLAREELVVLPRVAATIPVEEMDAIERGLLRRIGATRIAMTVAALERTARRERLPMPPLPLPARLALPLWRRRYRRVLAGAGIDEIVDVDLVGGAR